MATTAFRSPQRSKPAPESWLPQPASTPARSRRVSRGLLAMGVALVVVVALGMADLYAGAAHKVSVLVVARPVPAGATLGPADLKVAQVSASDQISAMAASDMSSVLGRPAAVPLAPGSLLERSEVRQGSALGAGQVVVAAALKDGSFPPGLRPGDEVSVVSTPTAQGGTASSTSKPIVVVSGAAVRGVAAPSSSSGTGESVVSLVVPSADGPAVAEAGASGSLSLVLLPGGNR